MYYLNGEELCQYYEVGEKEELLSTLAQEREIGSLYYRAEHLPMLEREDGRLPVVFPLIDPLPIEGGIPLLPFPIPGRLYDEVMAEDDEDGLLYTLALYKLQHVRGQFGNWPMASLAEIAGVMEQIRVDYDCHRPYRGRFLYWIDLANELTPVFDLPWEKGIEHMVVGGRKVRVYIRREVPECCH